MSATARTPPPDPESSALVEAALRRHERATPHTLHRLKLALAKLVASTASPSAQNQLGLVERFLEGRALAAELSDAKQDAWAYIGSLACYCSRTDSASAQAVLSCLEADDAAHTFASLREQAARVAACGIESAALIPALEDVALPRG
jgi:hypothetical protein